MLTHLLSYYRSHGQTRNQISVLLSTVFLAWLLAAPAWASTPPAGPLAGAPEHKGQPLAEVLNPDGTLKAGHNGSFDASGYWMLTAPNGKPVFRFTGTTGAGDENWQDGFNLPGTNGEVKAVVRSGSDFYIGGNFTTVGSIAANRIAKWNGTSWSSLGSGVDREVYALAVSGADVYAGGNFTTAGGVTATNIAKWNGTSWNAIGTGLHTVGGSPRNTVTSLASGSSGALYAGGSFTSVGDDSKMMSNFGIYRPQGVPTSTVAYRLSAQVKLYPNPASKIVFVVLPAEVRQMVHTVELVDAIGRVVQHQVLPNGAFPLQVSLQGVPPGVYSLRINTKQGTLSKRLVVE